MNKELNGKLFIIRHTESEWNDLGLWTGLTDVHLSENGVKNAKKVGELVKNINFDHAFITPLVRTKETLEFILEEKKEEYKNIPIEVAEELRERDYGDYTGKNKWEVEKIIGSNEFLKIRRSWDYNIPNGESLKMVYERATPFYVNRILPLVKEGKNVLWVGHGNTIRALTKYIEKLSDQDISDVEIDFGSVIIYNLDENGYSINKEIIKITIEN